MTGNCLRVAEMLEASAAGYASAANVLLQQSLNGSARKSGTPAQWKTHLTQRILELAIAVRVQDPSLFAERIAWLRRAMHARGSDESDLRAALESLHTALKRELPAELKSAIDAPMRLALRSLDIEVEPDARNLDASTETGKLAIEYLTACLTARTEEAVDLVISAIGERMTPQQAYTDVLLPAEREIGLLWHIGDISISEERLVTETTRNVMMLIVNRFAPEANPLLTVVAASVAGNAHDMGLRAAADLFRLDGWRSVFLGADMPTADIAMAAQSFNARLILLSATLTTQIGTLATAIVSIRQAIGDAKILVGGLAFQRSPELWKQLGADGYAPDVVSAIIKGRDLLGADRVLRDAMTDSH